MDEPKDESKDRNIYRHIDRQTNNAESSTVSICTYIYIDIVCFRSKSAVSQTRDRENGLNAPVSSV